MLLLYRRDTGKDSATRPLSSVSLTISVLSVVGRNTVSTSDSKDDPSSERQTIAKAGERTMKSTKVTRKVNSPKV